MSFNTQTGLRSVSRNPQSHPRSVPTTRTERSRVLTVLENIPPVYHQWLCPTHPTIFGYGSQRFWGLSTVYSYCSWRFTTVERVGVPRADGTGTSRGPSRRLSARRGVRTVRHFVTRGKIKNHRPTKGSTWYCCLARLLLFDFNVHCRDVDFRCIRVGYLLYLLLFLKKEPE